MAYLALYREWRPQRFDEVVGQDHVKRTLKNALSQDRIGHAYLFAGPRGTGKTSVAKVLAKAVNCLNNDSVEPCNECSACQSITRGSSMDVLEIDAASNRGIDEIRELRERVRYAPAEVRYKVYIIDEVHMLTQEAFNALLKTLEDPPSHVIFILATTEPHKLPLTILSRCQRFDFHLLATDLIASRLREVCEKHGMEAPSEAIMLIARHAEGGMRDALSLLDQVFSFGGDSFTTEDVLAVLGTAQDQLLFEFVDGLFQGDIKGLLELIDQLIRQGVDVRQFVRELISHCRNLLMVIVTDSPEQLVAATQEGLAALHEQASRLGQDKLLRLIDSLAALESRLRWSSQPRLVVEVEVLQLARSLSREGVGANEQRPVANAGLSAGGPAQDASRPVQKPKKATSAKANVPDDAPASTPGVQTGEAIDLKAQWEKVRGVVKQESTVAAALLNEVEPECLGEDTLVVRFRYEVLRERVKSEHAELLRQAVAQVFGRKLNVEMLYGDEQTSGGAASKRSRSVNNRDKLRRDTNSEPPERAGSAGVESQGKLEVDPESFDPLVKQALEIFGGQVVEIRDDEGTPDPEQNQKEDAT